MARIHPLRPLGLALLLAGACAPSLSTPAGIGPFRGGARSSAGAPRAAPADWLAPGTAPVIDLPASITGARPAPAAVAAVATGPASRWVACEPVSVAEGGLMAGRSLEICCSKTAIHHHDFQRGCMTSAPCGYSLGGGEPLETREALAAAVRPITSAREALALVALIDPEVWVPISDSERARISVLATEHGWQPPPVPIPAVNIEEDRNGFVVRVPTLAHCGCDHSLLRRSYRVDRSGVVVPLDEPERVLAFASMQICVD